MKKVLIVEDHAEVRRLIRMTLEEDDFEILEARNGELGLDTAMRALPDLIVLDVMMPGALDGLALCRRLKADPELARIKVLMLTACGTPADKERGKDAGADAYLLKPFSPMQLSRQVAQMLQLAAA